MSGTTDDLKGRAKQAAGAVTGDESLEREGRMDRATGAIKDAAEDVKDKVEDAVDTVREKLHR